MYADDHQIYHAGADQAAVTFQLKDSANLATTWCDSNLLAGNLKKYQVLNLGFTQNDSNIRVNDVTLVPEVFLDISPQERVAREPRSGKHESRSGEKEKPLVTLD